MDEAGIWAKSECGNTAYGKSSQSGMLYKVVFKADAVGDFKKLLTSI